MKSPRNMQELWASLSKVKLTTWGFCLRTRLQINNHLLECLDSRKTHKKHEISYEGMRDICQHNLISSVACSVLCFMLCL